MTSLAAASAAVAGAPSRIASAGPAGQHLRGRGAPAEHRCDHGERDLEHVVEHERHPFRRGECVHDDVERKAHGVREQGLLLRIDQGVPCRLERGHAGADLKRLFGPHPAPAERVQADPAGHRGEPAAQVLDAVATGPGKAQPGLLDGVVRICVRAGHAECDRVEIAALAPEFRRSSSSVTVLHRVERCHYQGRSTRR
jgi:hypothetical protein